MANEAGDKTFTVKDRRRFDSDGNERGSSAADEAASPASAAAPRPSAPREPSTRTSGAAPEVVGASKDADAADPSAVEGAEPGAIDFSSFIMSLATQALMQMGAVKPPDGLPVPVDLEGAKQTIDILSMLRERTKGNLDATEAHLVDEILHTLRMNYVARNR